MVMLGIAFAIVLIVLASTRSDATSTKYLSITRYEQNQTNWCWVAAAQTVIKFITGTEYSQCKVYDWGQTIGTGCANLSGTRTTEQTAVRIGTGHTPDWNADAIPGTKLVSEINAGHPIVVEIAYSSTHHHMATVYGYCSGCNGTTTVSLSNIPSPVGTGKSAPISTVTLAYLASNSSYSTQAYLWDISK